MSDALLASSSMRMIAETIKNFIPDISLIKLDVSFAVSYPIKNIITVLNPETTVSNMEHFIGYFRSNGPYLSGSDFRLYGVGILDIIGVIEYGVDELVYVMIDLKHNSIMQLISGGPSKNQSWSFNMTNLFWNNCNYILNEPMMCIYCQSGTRDFVVDPQRNRTNAGGGSVDDRVKWGGYSVNGITILNKNGYASMITLPYLGGAQFHLSSISAVSSTSKLTGAFVDDAITFVYLSAVSSTGNGYFIFSQISSSSYKVVSTANADINQQSLWLGGYLMIPTTVSNQTIYVAYCRVGTTWSPGTVNMPNVGLYTYPLNGGYAYVGAGKSSIVIPAVRVSDGVGGFTVMNMKKQVQFYAGRLIAAFSHYILCTTDDGATYTRFDCANWLNSSDGSSSAFQYPMQIAIKEDIKLYPGNIQPFPVGSDGAIYFVSYQTTPNLFRVIYDASGNKIFPD